MCRFCWRTLYRKDFLSRNHISFVDGILFEDVPFINECFLKVQKCLRTAWLLNIYRRRDDSISSRNSLRKSKDRTLAISRCWELTKQSGLSPDMKSRQQDLVFCLFYSHVSAIAYGHLNGLSEVVQAIDFLKAAIPDLTFSHGTKQKLWTVMLHKMPTPVLGALLYSKQMLLKRIHRAAQGPNGA